MLDLILYGLDIAKLFWLSLFDEIFASDKRGMLMLSYLETDLMFSRPYVCENFPLRSLGLIKVTDLFAVKEFLSGVNSLVFNFTSIFTFSTESYNNDGSYKFNY